MASLKEMSLKDYLTEIIITGGVNAIGTQEPLKPIKIILAKED